MKTTKKIISILLSLLMVLLCFAGCSKSEEAQEINDETMLIAYTAENAPFISSKGNSFEGFDVDLFKAIEENIKGEYKNYKFIQVEEGYKIGEDVAYTDKDSNEYIANIMVGGIQSNTGTINEDYSLTEPLITNRIITAVSKGSNIKSYSDLNGAKIGIVTKQAQDALNKNTAIKNGIKEIKNYDDAKTALNDLSSNKIDAVIIDEFSFYNTASASEELVVLNGELDSINYVFAIKKWDGLRDSINEAVYELKSEDYEGEDKFTPIVEKHFGYNASSFNYIPSN